MGCFGIFLLFVFDIYIVVFLYIVGMFMLVCLVIC